MINGPEGCRRWLSSLILFCRFSKVVGGRNKKERLVGADAETSGLRPAGSFIRGRGRDSKTGKSGHRKNETVTLTLIVNELVCLNVRFGLYLKLIVNERRVPIFNGA
jgi:hypothetical protein